MLGSDFVNIYNLYVNNEGNLFCSSYQKPGYSSGKKKRTHVFNLG